jgi:hypothetical protein
VWINKHLDMAPNIPFGGAKQSGIGTEFAEEGLAEFTQSLQLNPSWRFGRFTLERHQVRAAGNHSHDTELAGSGH